MATVYTMIGLTPNDETRDMLQEQTFSAIAQSDITDYQLRIYDLDTNDLLYDGGKVSQVLYATQELEVIIPVTSSLALVRELKWTLEGFNGASSVVTREIPFTNYETASLNLASTPSTVTTQYYEFIMNYSHPQDIPIIRFEIERYDADENLIDSSGVIYNSSIRYTFDNFLDGSIYKVKGYAVDENEVEIETSMIQFLVDYAEPSVTFSPIVENKSNISGIEVKYGGAYSLGGIVTGTYRYIDDFIETDNNGIELDIDTKIQWDGVNIGEQNIGSVLLKPYEFNYGGDITRLTNTTTSDYLTIGYDYSINQFYMEQNGIRRYTKEFNLSPLNCYLLYWSIDELVIKTYDYGSSWSTISSGTWSDITTLTWLDIAR